MSSVNKKMTSLADEIRELSGTTDKLGIDAMVSDISAVNIEILRQAELLAQIITVLESKTGGEVVEERLEGDGQEFYTTAPSTLSFRSTAPLNELQDVQINGQTVDPSNYTLEEGSTIVKLKHEYLSTLDTGKYELSVVSDSKTVKGDFIVNKPVLNEHGFYYNVPYVITLNGYSTVMDYEFDNEIISLFTIKEDDSAHRFDVSNGELLPTVFEYSDNHVIIEFEIYHFEGYFSADGKSIEITNVTLMSELDKTLNVSVIQNTDVVCCDEYYTYIRLYGYEDEWIAASIDATTSTTKPIKAMVKGMPVTQLADFCFVNNEYVKILEMIPTTVTYLGASAFSGCSSIEVLNIPSHITATGATCFGYCVNLQSVTIPASFTYIEPHLFYECINLRNIVYEGTMSEWNNICTEFSDDWNTNVPATYVQCSDGQVSI